MTPAARAATVGLGAVVARAMVGPACAASSIRLDHRGHAVSLAGGPAVTVAATASAAVARLADGRPGSRRPRSSPASAPGRPATTTTP